VMAKNPDVTVRERGVMEKCSFCVQRIREAEIGAGREGRELRGSEVRTACQQACPTKAIVFGSLDEPDSEMARLRREPRAYSALGDLGTEPRVRYLARIRNTNPDVGQQP
jgi:Fe-S-cluster-containing dehydrogenase component